MKRKSFFITLFFPLILGMVCSFSAHAQNSPKILTLLYSNNINGEIEPCPT